jgi:predicted TIM-barrel fold metal-dependent hydrolase
MAIEVIDAHLHVWDETAAGKDPGPMAVGYSAQSVATLELFQDYMEEAGVRKAVFVQPWFYHWDNSYLTRSIHRAPERFRGVCVIDPRGPQAPVELRKWRAQGITGIRLRAFRPGEGPVDRPWFGTDETLPLWEAFAETGTIVTALWPGREVTRLHELLARFPNVRVIIDHLNKPVPGEGPVGGPWFGTDETLPLWEAFAETGTIVTALWPGRGVTRLHGLLARFPNVRVIIDHLNKPVPSEGVEQPRFQALLELASLPTVHVKLSGFHHWCLDRYPYPSAMPFVQAAVAAFGADRCMWGSDFPHVLAGCGYVRNRNLLARAATFLSPGELDAIMGGTAARVWFDD